MAKKTKAAKAAATGAAVKGAKNVKDLSTTVDQDQLRDNVRVAFEAARDAYERVNGKGAAALFEDPKFHEDIRGVASAVRGASSAVQPKKKKKGGLGRLVLFGIVGSVAAVALSEGLRNKLLDALFGAEEEFDYTSTTTPNPASAGPGASTPSAAGASS